jgi:hypothetical protein
VQSGLLLAGIASIGAGVGLVGMGVGRLLRSGTLIAIAGITGGLGLTVLEIEDFDPDLGNIAIIGVGLALIGYGVNELRTSELGRAAMAGLKSLTLESDQERSHANSEPTSSVRGSL